jgi:hypothetical protein
VTIREGKWRCPYCSIVNRGADLACTGCGATRDKDVTFFLEDDAAEVTDDKLLAKAQAGADWLCLFCQTSNRPAADHCVQCGAERGTAPSRPVRDVPDQPPAPQPVASPRKKSGCGLIVGVVVLLALAFCSVCAYLSFRKSEDRVTVTGFEWSRSIDVQALRVVRDKAWDGEVPTGATVVSRSNEVHHTEHVQVGTHKVKVGRKDLGNGFFKDIYEDRPVYQDHPVYRARVTYDIPRWVADRTARADGHDQSPHWPDPGVGLSMREAGRHESYLVLLRGGRDYRFELPESRWSALRQGQSLHAEIQGGSHVLSIE